MINTLSITLSLAAGFIGGVLSHYLFQQPVQAQTTSVNVVTAQQFVLQDEAGKVLGRLAIRKTDGTGCFELFDAKGEVKFGRPFKAKSCP